VGCAEKFRRLKEELSSNRGSVRKSRAVECRGHRQHMHRSRGKIILFFFISHLSVTQLFAHINLFLLLLSKSYVLTILL
jgi:hypothetical protein